MFYRPPGAESGKLRLQGTHRNRGKYEIPEIHKYMDIQEYGELRRSENQYEEAMTMIQFLT